jgi:predicted nucleotidyltransferase component of viral defense system
MEERLVNILKLRGKVLKALNGKLNTFFLGGGTALSLFYLHHRESFDLDLFSKIFSESKIKVTISIIEDSLKVKTKGGQILTAKESARFFRYYVPMDNQKELDIEKDSLKVEFIEDPYPIVESHDVIIDGVRVFSQENVYLRKIYALCGVRALQDEVGKVRFIGGRQEAKDLFDVYFLSKEFMPLSNFVHDFCPTEKEKIIVWYNSYNRQDMKLGITELIIRKEVDFYEIEKHFKAEIKKIIEQELI